jgi:hypothetical protein
VQIHLERFDELVKLDQFAGLGEKKGGGAV